MQPTRDPRATLPDLIEVLLNKGVYLNLDLIISVADIPLIGVNLRATIAGIETMLEYGMMRQWDEQTRAWVQRSVTAHLPMATDEAIVAKMAGGHYQDNFYRTWRPGSAYLTNRRLIIHRRDPAETLWQSDLSAIASIRPLRQRSTGGEERTRIAVTLSDGEQATLSAVDPERLISLTREQRRRALEPEATTAVGPHETRGTSAGGALGDDLAPGPDAPLHQGPVWYLESLAEGGVWRAGTATLTETEGLVWTSPADRRARVRIPPRDVTDLRLESHRNPTDASRTLVVSTNRRTVRLATDDAEHWARAVMSLLAEDRRDRADHEGRTAHDPEAHDGPAG
ncbi:gas vesicle protein [Georgenia sp. Z1491]|uniref:gas vesicle protein n=1 Tax=Georgenia sp. Z1491 TaxID=3416707 RepID=UPI003CF91A35